MEYLLYIILLFFLVGSYNTDTFHIEIYTYGFYSKKIIMCDEMEKQPPDERNVTIKWKAAPANASERHIIREKKEKESNNKKKRKKK